MVSNSKHYVKAPIGVFLSELFCVLYTTREL
nr:MAG TPA: hypothetical protein [Caudoviricetes sp.]